MEEFFLSLDITMQTFWMVAIVATIIFAVQAVFTFIGIESADGMDMDVDVSDGDTMDAGGMMSIFSIRSVVNFFVGFGWAGVSLRPMISQDWLLYIVAVIVGLAFGYLYIFFRRKLMKLESNGAYKLKDAIGKEADVYLRIPENGRGKVQVSIGGSIHEIDAISASGEIATGSRVRIVEIQGNVAKVESC